MGMETSKLPDLEIEERNVEVTADWTMHKAHVYSEKPYSVSLFVFEPSNDLTIKKTILLECCAKNLLMYRHPCILKYISSWWSKGSFYLATEVAKPLGHVLQNQSPLQICVGLHAVLKAINFLHRKAQVSHNNLCRGAIYVSPDGVWKLGGFEHLCPFSKLNSAFLQKARDNRYQKAIAPEEESLESFVSSPSSIDHFAFGILVEEVLNCENEDEVPALKEFRELAKTQLQNVRPTSRPAFSTLLTHDFFSHDFIRVYSFLVELPIKTEEEKKSFFSCVVDQLLTFPEILVAKQLSSLLLARLVLLDSAAQECLLPQVLCPRTDGETGLLSPNVYRQHIIPQLLQIFCVRDAQIRLVLLKHFKHYFHMFTLEQLKNQVLPELLVGIKDTNDLLVTATLCALAELVPVLGATAVIGGKRARLFTDGRPLVVGHQSRATQLHCDPNNITSCDVQLSERPSPDGGEDQTSSDEETAVWSDWENNGETNVPDSVLEEKQKSSSRRQEKPPQTLNDISFLDIKSVPTSSQDEFNYFQDMEPIISKPPVAQIDQNTEHSVWSPQEVSSRLFAVDASEHDKWLAEGDGWGDDIVDWDNSENNKDDIEDENGVA